MLHQDASMTKNRAKRERAARLRAIAEQDSRSITLITSGKAPVALRSASKAHAKEARHIRESQYSRCSNSGMDRVVKNGCRSAPTWFRPGQ